MLLLQLAKIIRKILSIKLAIKFKQFLKPILGLESLNLFFANG